MGAGKLKLRSVHFSWIWYVLSFLGGDQDKELKGDIDLEAVVNPIYRGSGIHVLSSRLTVQNRNTPSFYFIPTFPVLTGFMF